MGDHGRGFLRSLSRQKMLWISIGLSVTYGILASAVHAFVSHRSSFLQMLLTPMPTELVVNSLVISGLIALGIYVQRVMTQRARAEEALRVGKERFRTIYSQAPIGIELYDAGGKLIDANATCLDMFGVESIDEVRGFDLFADPNLPLEAKERLAKGESVKFESVFDFELVRQKGL